jgi:hypothetical protein
VAFRSCLQFIIRLAYVHAAIIAAGEEIGGITPASPGRSPRTCFCSWSRAPDPPGSYPSSLSLPWLEQSCVTSQPNRVPGAVRGIGQAFSVLVGLYHGADRTPPWDRWGMRSAPGSHGASSSPPLTTVLTGTVCGGGAGAAKGGFVVAGLLTNFESAGLTEKRAPAIRGEKLSHHHSFKSLSKTVPLHLAHLGSSVPDSLLDLRGSEALAFVAAHGL